jgi:integrase
MDLRTHVHAIVITIYTLGMVNLMNNCNKMSLRSVLAKKLRSVSEFIEQLATESTRNNYQNCLKHFFAFVSGELFTRRGYIERLDEISLEYLSRKPDYEQDYVRYQNSIKERLAPKTVALRMLAVKTYFDANDIELKNSFLKRVNGRKVIQPISEEKIPLREEVKLILQHLPLHIKTYALFLLSGGMRPSEPLALKLNDVQDDGVLTKIKLKARDTKTGKKRWTYITPEATESLRLWL